MRDLLGPGPAFKSKTELEEALDRAAQPYEIWKERLPPDLRDLSWTKVIVRHFNVRAASIVSTQRLGEIAAQPPICLCGDSALEPIVGRETRYKRSHVLLLTPPGADLAKDPASLLDGARYIPAFLSGDAGCRGLRVDDLYLTVIEGHMMCPHEGVISPVAAAVAVSKMRGGSARAIDRLDKWTATSEAQVFAARLRLESGWSKAEVAEHIDIFRGAKKKTTQPTLSKYEGFESKNPQEESKHGTMWPGRGTPLLMDLALRRGLLPVHSNRDFALWQEVCENLIARPAEQRRSVTSFGIREKPQREDRGAVHFYCPEKGPCLAKPVTAELRWIENWRYKSGFTPTTVAPGATSAATESLTSRLCIRSSFSTPEGRIAGR